MEGGMVPTDVEVIVAVAVPIAAVDCGTGVSVGDEDIVGVDGEEVVVLVAGLQAASTNIVNQKNRFNPLSCGQNCSSYITSSLQTNLSPPFVRRSLG